MGGIGGKGEEEKEGGKERGVTWRGKGREGRRTDGCVAA